MLRTIPLKPYIPIIFCTLIFSFISTEVFAQKFLVLDRYGKKRVKLMEGDHIHFKQKGNKTLYQDVIKELGDSTITIGSRNLSIHINEFSAFYFPNSGVRFASAGTGFIGGGFLFAAAVSPLINEKRYDPKESAIIGASFLAASQLLKLFKWRKFKLKNDNSRIRILDTNPQPEFLRN